MEGTPTRQTTDFPGCYWIGIDKTGRSEPGKRRGSRWGVTGHTGVSSFLEILKTTWLINTQCALQRLACTSSMRWRDSDKPTDRRTRQIIWCGLLPRFLLLWHVDIFNPTTDTCFALLRFVLYVRLLMNIAYVSCCIPAILNGTAAWVFALSFTARHEHVSPSTNWARQRGPKCRHLWVVFVQQRSSQLINPRIARASSEALIELRLILEVWPELGWIQQLLTFAPLHKDINYHVREHKSDSGPGIGSPVCNRRRRKRNLVTYTGFLDPNSWYTHHLRLCSSRATPWGEKHQSQ